MFTICLLIGWGLAISALGYAAGAYYCVRPMKDSKPAPSFAPPVTLLKPLCGAEAGLYETLRSCFELDYPHYQIVFGVRDAGDPALNIVARLKAEFPAVPVAIAVDPQIHGTNLKISNLMNMERLAHHDVLVIADSDIAAAPDYLRQVIPLLADEAIGVVTCAYLARPLKPKLASTLAAMQINEWFLPSVLVARAMGRANFCMGSTMAVRRDSLAKIGGLAALKDLLADDYMLGHLMNQKGYNVAIAPCLVETTVPEDQLAPVIRHELRWARTIRTVEPASYFGSVLTYTLPICLLASVFLAIGGSSVPMIAAAPFSAIVVRLALHARVRRVFASARALWWLVPIRDILSFGVWVASFAGRSVEWRGQQLHVDAQGVLSKSVSEVQRENSISQSAVL